MKNLPQTIRLSLVAGAAAFALPLTARAALAAPTVVVTEQKPKQISALWYGEVWGVTDRRDSSALSSYSVTLTNKKTGKVVKSLETTDNTGTFTGLKPNRAYKIAVTMVRGSEVSEPEVVTARTRPQKATKLKVATVARQIHRDVIDNTPLNQFGDAASSKWIARLTWNKPDGKIRYYTVNVYNKRGKKVASEKTKRRVVGVSGLKLKTPYWYEVVSHFNGDNESEASARKKFKLKKKY